MKFTVTLPLVLEVDLDIDNGVFNLDYIQEDIMYAIKGQLTEDEFLENLTESVTDHTSWCVNSLILKLDKNI